MNITHKGSYATVTRWEVEEGDHIAWIDSKSGPVGLQFTIDVMPPHWTGKTVEADLALVAKALPEIWKKIQEMDGGDDDLTLSRTPKGGSSLTLGCVPQI